MSLLQWRGCRTSGSAPAVARPVPSGELIEKRLAANAVVAGRQTTGLTISSISRTPRRPVNELDPARRRHMAAKPVVTAIPTGLNRPLLCQPGRITDAPGEKTSHEQSRARGRIAIGETIRTANVRTQSPRQANFAGLCNAVDPRGCRLQRRTAHQGGARRNRRTRAPERANQKRFRWACCVPDSDGCRSS